MARPYFTRALFAYLEDLAAHNDREWFQANRDRYEEQYRQPALRFIADFGPQVRAVSPHLVCDPRPTGGSLFRIYRDVRFSKDKRPYKTHCAMQFRHEAGKDAHAPGLYLHLEPGGCFAAAGMWRPPTAGCRTVREAIAADPDRWRAAVGDLERFGEQLKRVPAGYAKDHPAADELRWKDFGVMRALTQKDVLAADAHARIGAVFLEMRPMLGFLCEALGQPF
ncbi:TIGR02453 family protein [bacterium]|nr:TIGR02453 family protein [bacterium]